MEKYKVVIVVGIVLWSIYCINTTFQLVIMERHVKQLEKVTSEQEATIDSLMDDVIELEDK